MKDKIEKCLKAFYDSLSFPEGGWMDEDGLRACFTPFGLLIGQEGKEYVVKSVGEHIREWREIRRKNPQVLAKGLQEKQISWEYLPGDDFVLVKSRYEKRYHNGTEWICEEGCNNFSFSVDSEPYRIVSVLWKENQG